MSIRLSSSSTTEDSDTVSLTLMFFKSLYPRAILDAVGEGLVASYTEEEASKLVDDSIEMA
jgi:hypothetical protein